MGAVKPVTEKNDLVPKKKEPPTMKLEEIAKELRVSYQTAYKLAKEGKIPSLKQIGSLWRADRATFREWLKSSETGESQ